MEQNYLTVREERIRQERKLRREQGGVLSLNRRDGDDSSEDYGDSESRDQNNNLNDERKEREFRPIFS